MQFEINSKIDFFLLNKETLKGERKEERMKDRQTGLFSESNTNTQKQEPKAVIIPLTEKYERKIGENYDYMNDI